MTTQLEVKKQFLASLSKAIKGDRHFFVAAKVDPNFNPLRTDVDDLLRQLTQETKAQAEEAIAYAQTALNEMEDWHAYEAASSEYNSALNTVAKARENFQSGSYFGYLNAQSLAGEAKKEAKNAIDAKKAHMTEAIDKLKSQAAQLWEDGGDFEKYEVKKYAPTELEAALRAAREGWKCSEVETYANYKKAQSSLKKCLRLGFVALEKAIHSLMECELKKLKRKVGARLLALGIVLSVLVATNIYAVTKNFEGVWETFNLMSLFGPLGIALLVIAFVVLLINGKRKESPIRDQYERLKAKVKDKYTPAS